jgi:hypothetical protein
VNYEFPVCKHRNPPGEGLTSGVVTIAGVPDLSCHACALERRDEQIRVLRAALEFYATGPQEWTKARDVLDRAAALAATETAKEGK